MLEITHKITGKTLFKSETATTVKMAVEEAITSKADLSKANLRQADLSKANLWQANLSEADLSKADLSEANLLYCKMTKEVFKQITKEWFEWKISD